jgi:cell division protein FtsL
MQAPLRRGKKETLGRANGVKRAGRSFLLGSFIVALVTISSLAYTWERLLVERMLRQNLALENTLELIQKRTERLSFEVAALSGLTRIEEAAAVDLGMASMDWEDVIVVRGYLGDGK